MRPSETDMLYQLNFTIDAAGVAAINESSQQVTIVKSVQPASGNSPVVAWVSFVPLESDTVTWQENYTIYATTQQLSDGATIVMTSQTSEPVQLDQQYTFQNGVFSASSGGSNTAFTAVNQNGGAFSFGLAQQAVINNVTVNAPLNAVVLLNNENVAFTPEETVSIFLSNTTNNGVVLSQVSGNALTVTLSSQAPVANIAFNDKQNTFSVTSTSSNLSNVQRASRFAALC